MRTIITYGTFDLFHEGHVNLLARAKALGDRLIVGCSTDEFNEQKEKKSFIPYSSRAKILSACRYVDVVIPEDSWEQKVSDISLYEVDCFVMGSDWKGRFDFLLPYCEVVYLERTPDISTSYIKKALGS